VLELQTQCSYLTFSMYHWLFFSFCSFFLIQYGMDCCSASGALVYKAQSHDEDVLVQATFQLQMLLCNKIRSVVGGYILFHHNFATPYIQLKYL